MSSSATARTPPYDSRDDVPSDFRRWSITAEMRVMTSGEISSRFAMRVITSMRNSSGSVLASCAACAGLRCARISAMVCGCSLRMNLDNCCGSALSRPVKAIDDSNDLITRSSTRRAISGPSDLTSTFWAYSTPPCDRILGRLPHVMELFENGRTRRRA